MPESYTQSYQHAQAVACYEGSIYAPDSHDSILWSVEQRVMDSLLRKQLADSNSVAALDFACGTGRILEYLRPRVRTLVGVDVSEAMLAKARQKVSDADLFCVNICEEPEKVPGEKDLITSFRFLLLAEPALRVACIRQLAGKLKQDGVMILNSHGNKWSYRLTAELRNRLFWPSKPRLPTFTFADMRLLADECGMEIVKTTGLGFVPPSLVRLLPKNISQFVERILADRPLIWRFGSNLFFVCRRKTR
jgi:SAM-dependent methyltransferase